MRNPEGESDHGPLRPLFDRRLKLEFHGSRVTSDAGLLAYRELDDALGLTALAGGVLADSRTGRNGWHGIVSLLRRDHVPHRVHADFTVADGEILARAACSSGRDFCWRLAVLYCGFDGLSDALGGGPAGRGRRHGRTAGSSRGRHARACARRWDRGTPLATAWLATVCLRSCRRTSSSPAAFRARLQRCSMCESGLSECLGDGNT